MNTLRLVLIAGLCAIAASVSFGQDRPLIPLPADPSAVIISMDRQGYAERKNPAPLLTIRASGRVTVIDPVGRVGDKETVLPPAQIQELLHFITVEQDFFSFNASDVRQSVDSYETELRQRAGIGVSVSHLSATVLHITTGGKDQDASFKGLSYWAERYPYIKTLAQLHAIELKLSHLEETLRAGRKTEVEAALDRANAYLMETRPTIPALNINNYRSTQVSPAGVPSIRFERSNPGDTTNISVTVAFPRSAPPRVTLE